MKTYRITNFALIIIIGISFYSCEGDYELLRYPYVEIPEYNRSDYSQLYLSTRNDEISYNSICNLIGSADHYSDILNNDTIARNDSIYQEALLVYKQAQAGTKSKNSWLASASLRFIGLVAEDFDYNDSVITKVLAVNSKNRHVQLEQLSTLELLVNHKDSIPNKWLRSRLHHKSWLVSRKSYATINMLADKKCRAELMEKYKQSSEDYEKLLILSAFRNRGDESTFELYTAELESQSDTKIRSFILKSLDNLQSQHQVLNWLRDNYKVLSDNDKHVIAEHYFTKIDQEFAAKITILLLQKSFNVLNVKDHDDKIILFKELDRKQNDYQQKTNPTESDSLKLENINNVMAELKKHSEFHLAMDKYKLEREGVDFFPVEFIKSYNKNLDEFIAKTEAEIRKNKLSPEVAKVIMENMEELRAE
ncbi:MAG: hypothetical protein MI922_04285 [Bacteroidales bacterium]|nr:hypothetical protein [Bacteroidales bacterium]